MKGKIIVLLAIIAFFIACSKDKFQTKPTLKLKSISSKNIIPGGDMNIELEYTDKEGDLSGDSLTFIKVRNNKWTTPSVGRDTIVFVLGEFPKRDKGVIELLLSNTNLVVAQDPKGPGGIIQNDSITMKFIVHDNASHFSDTLKVGDIVIGRN